MSGKKGFLGNIFDDCTILWFIILFLLLFYCCGGFGGSFCRDDRLDIDPVE